MPPASNDDGGGGRANFSGGVDPWSQVEDLDGDLHYRVLDLGRRATSDEIKRAYYKMARTCHPDKGGSAAKFSAVQKAFHVLSDPQQRAVYDTWAKNLEFRYVPGVASKAAGGEDKLLDEFENLGLHCDSMTQLIVTCEVCQRPSTKECWTCKMKICDFCTLKRHWKGSLGLHWPLINSDHMKDNLGKRELEMKKKDDEKRHALEDPNHRDEADLQVIRDFKAASGKMLGRQDRLMCYDLSLAQFYMWTQTEDFVFLACFIPTGYQDKEIMMDFNGNAITIQPEDSPPLLQRLLDYSIDTTRPIESFKTSDNRFLTICIPKPQMSEPWLRVFQGDSDGVRCMEPLYALTELDDEVILELELPQWVEFDDVRVKIEPSGLTIDVRSSFTVKRTFWKDSAEESRRSTYAVINVEESSWCLEDDANAAGEPCKMLTISLMKPPMTYDDQVFKKGVRSDNRSKERDGSRLTKGYRFFADDEDHFLLEDVLQAICFMQTGSTYVPAKPWDQTACNKWVKKVEALPEPVQTVIENMLNGTDSSG